jgi:HEAT repeat protein
VQKGLPAKTAPCFSFCDSFVAARIPFLRAALYDTLQVRFVSFFSSITSGFSLCLCGPVKDILLHFVKKILQNTKLLPHCFFPLPFLYLLFTYACSARINFGTKIMAAKKIYKVIIPYSESSNPRKKFKIEYRVEAPNRSSALQKAEHEFSSYSDYNSASWVRTLARDGIRIWKILPDLPQTPAHIDELAAQLASEDEDILYNCLKTLAELEDSSASDQIISLFSHKNPEIVALAVETLGKIGDPSNLSAITGLCKKARHPRVKACLITAISKLALPDDEILGIVSKALTDEDSRVRANAVEALENMKLADTARLLLPMLEDEDNRVRANVIKALWNKDDHDKLLTALKKMANDDNPWMKASCIFVLDRVDIPGRIELLGAMCREDHPKIRENARQALFNANTIDCLPYWLELISNDEELALVSKKVLRFGDKAVNTLLSFNGSNENSKNNAAILLDMLEQHILKKSGWISWLKTKQKRLFKTP